MFEFIYTTSSQFSHGQPIAVWGCLYLNSRVAPAELDKDGRELLPTGG